MEKYCVREDYTIKEVIEKFETDNDRVAIVVNENNKVVGIVSQGDILRAITRGVNIFVQVNQIIANSFLHLYNKDMEKAKDIFVKKRISLLPILNEENELVDVITIADIFEYLGNCKRK